MVNDNFWGGVRYPCKSRFTVEGITLVCDVDYFHYTHGAVVPTKPSRHWYWEDHEEDPR